MTNESAGNGSKQHVQELKDFGNEDNGEEGPFTPYPGAAVFVGEATVSGCLPPRIPAEGPVLILDAPEFRAVRYRNDIPPNAAGVMEFPAGPVILKEAVLIEVTAAITEFSATENIETHSDGTRLGYVVATPLVFERFAVVGNRLRFVVRAGHPCWKLAPGEIDTATATYLNLFLS